MITARSNGDPRIKPFKVLVSLVTLVAFLFNTVSYDIAILRPINVAGQAWAAGTPSELPGGGSDRTGGSSPFKELHVDKFTLPGYLGQIKYQFKSDSPGKTIIHIQDAHCNYAAQHKIAEIIEYLNKEYGIDTVNLEGGAKDYDLSAFADVPDRALRAKAADYFVKAGLVNGAEYFAVNNPGKINLWGIEDTGLYIDNLNIYRDSLAHKEEVDRHLRSLSAVLSGLKTKIYSKELLDFDMKYGAYKAGNMEFKDYLNSIMTIAANKKLDLSALSAIDLLNKTLADEAAIDFKKANMERDELIGRLEKRLSKKALEGFIVKTVEFKAERISQKDFYAYITEKAKQRDIEISGFTDLQKYITYVSRYDAIDKSKVMEEIDALESDVRRALCRNDEDARLSVLSKNLSLLKNIFGITLTKDDYRYYRSNEASFDMRSFTSFIDKYAALHGIAVKTDDNIRNVDRYRKEIERFYEYSLKRDDAFMKNIKLAYSVERRADSKNDNARSPLHANKTAILVTGGFHTENLAELFKKQGISYVSIMPNFKNCDGYDCPYFKVLSGEKYTDIREALPSVLAHALAVPDQLSIEMKAALNRAGLDAARPEIPPAASAEKPLAEKPAEPETQPVRSQEGFRGNISQALGLISMIMMVISHPLESASAAAMDEAAGETGMPKNSLVERYGGFSRQPLEKAEALARLDRVYGEINKNTAYGERAGDQRVKVGTAPNGRDITVITGVHGSQTGLDTAYEFLKEKILKENIDPNEWVFLIEGMSAKGSRFIEIEFLKRAARELGIRTEESIINPYGGANLKAASDESGTGLDELYYHAISAFLEAGEDKARVMEYFARERGVTPEAIQATWEDIAGQKIEKFKGSPEGLKGETEKANELIVKTSHKASRQLLSKNIGDKRHVLLYLGEGHVPVVHDLFGQDGWKEYKTGSHKGSVGGASAAAKPLMRRVGGEDVYYGKFEPATGTILVDIAGAKAAFEGIVSGLDDVRITGFVHAHEVFHALIDNRGFEIEEAEVEKLADIFAMKVMGMSPPKTDEERFRSIITDSVIRNQFNTPYTSESFLLNLHNLGIDIYNIENVNLASKPTVAPQPKKQSSVSLPITSSAFPGGIGQYIGVPRKAVYAAGQGEEFDNIVIEEMAKQRGISVEDLEADFERNVTMLEEKIKFTGFVDPEKDEIANKIHSIFDRVIEAYRTKTDEAPGNFHIVDANNVNAFVIRKRTDVYFYKGLYEAMYDAAQRMNATLTEDMIAFIIAHELSHALQHTSHEGLDVKDMNESVSPYLVQMIKNGEYDADMRALDLMDTAGYSIFGAIDAMSFLEFINTSSQAENVLSSHPYVSLRKHRLSQIILDQKTNVFKNVKAQRSGMPGSGRMASRDADFRSMADKSAEEIWATVQGAKDITALDQLTGMYVIKRRMSALRTLAKEKSLQTSFMQNIYMQAAISTIIGPASSMHITIPESVDYSNMKEAAAIHDFGAEPAEGSVLTKQPDKFENRADEKFAELDKHFSYFSSSKDIMEIKNMLQNMASIIKSKAARLDENDFDGFLLPREEVKDIIPLFSIAKGDAFRTSASAGVEMVIPDKAVIKNAISNPKKLISAFLYANYLGQEPFLEVGVPTTQMKVKLLRNKNSIYLENPSYRDTASPDQRKKLQDIVLLNYVIKRNGSGVSDDNIDYHFPGLDTGCKAAPDTAAEYFTHCFKLLSEKYPGPVAVIMAVERLSEYLGVYASRLTSFPAVAEIMNGEYTAAHFIDKVKSVRKSAESEYAGDPSARDASIEKKVSDFIDSHPLMIFINKSLKDYAGRLPEEEVNKMAEAVAGLKKGGGSFGAQGDINTIIRGIAGICAEGPVRYADVSEVFSSETSLHYYLKYNSVDSFEALSALPDWAVSDYINKKTYGAGRIIEHALAKGVPMDDIFTFMKSRLSYDDRRKIFETAFLGYHAKPVYLFNHMKRNLHNDPKEIILWFMGMFSRKDALGLIDKLCCERLYKKAKETNDGDEAIVLSKAVTGLLEYCFKNTSRTFHASSESVKVYLDTVSADMARSGTSEDSASALGSVYDAMMLLSAAADLNLVLSQPEEWSDTEGSPDFRSKFTSLKPTSGFGGTKYAEYKSSLGVHNFGWNDKEAKQQSIFVRRMAELSVEQLRQILKERQRYMRSKADVEYRGEALSAANSNDFFSNLVTLMILEKTKRPGWGDSGKSEELADIIGTKVTYEQKDNGKLGISNARVFFNPIRIASIPIKDVKANLCDVSIPSGELDPVWEGYVKVNSLQGRLPELATLIQNPNAGNELIYNPLKFIEKFKYGKKVSYRQLAAKFFMGSSVYARLFNEYCKISGKGYVYGQFKPLPERVEWLNSALPGKSVIKDGIVDLWETDIFPEIISDMPVLVQMAQKLTSEEGGFNDMWTLLGEMDDDVGRLKRLNDQISLPRDRIDALMQFYGSVIPYVFSPQKLARYGATMYMLWKQIPGNADLGLQDNLDALAKFMPEPSVLRDEMLMRLANKYVRHLDEAPRVCEMLYFNNLLSRNRDLRSEDFVSETLMHLFGAAKTEDRKDILLWIVGAREKPEFVSAKEEEYKIDFSTLPSDVKLLPVSIRERLIEGFMLGDNGVLDPKNESDKSVMSDFLENMFLFIFPSGTKGIQDEERALLSRVFGTIMRSYPPYRRVQVIKALAALRLRHDFDRTSTGERLAVLLGALGPVGIKVAQYLSENETLVPDEGIRSSLGALRHKAPEITKVSACSVLENEIPMSEVLVREIGEPAGIASIKQVNRGKWLDVELLAELVFKKTAGPETEEVNGKLRAYKAKEVGFAEFSEYVVNKAKKYNIDLRLATIPVVYKIRRPNIDTTLSIDFAALDAVAKDLEGTVYRNNVLNISDLVQTVKEWILLEKDFKNEVEFSNMISGLDTGWADSLEKAAGVKITNPRVLYSSDSIIVEEEVKGIPILHLAPKQQAVTIDDITNAGYSRTEADDVMSRLKRLDPVRGHIFLGLKKSGFPETSLTSMTGRMSDYDYSKLRDLLRGVLLHQIFIDGVFHADLHQGNSLITPGGKLYMIDRGNVGTLNREQIEGAKILMRGFLFRESGLIKQGLDRIFMHAIHAEGAQPFMPDITAEDIQNILDKGFDLKVTMNMVGIKASRGAKNTAGGKDFSTFLKAFTQAMYLFPTDLKNGQNTLEAIAKYIDMESDKIKGAAREQAKYVKVTDTGAEEKGSEAPEEDVAGMVKRVFKKNWAGRLLGPILGPIIFRIMMIPVNNIISTVSRSGGNIIPMARSYGVPFIEQNIKAFAKRQDLEIADAISEVMTTITVNRFVSIYVESGLRKSFIGRLMSLLVMPALNVFLILASPFTGIIVDSVREWIKTAGRRYIASIAPQMSMKESVDLLWQIFPEDFGKIKEKFEEYRKTGKAKPAVSKAQEAKPLMRRVGGEDVYYGKFEPATGTILVDIAGAKAAFEEIVSGFDDVRITGFVHAHEVFHALIDKRGVDIEEAEVEKLADIFAMKVMGLSPPKADEELFMSKITDFPILNQFNTPYTSESFLLNLHNLGIDIYNIENTNLAQAPKDKKEIQTTANGTSVISKAYKIYTPDETAKMEEAVAVFLAKARSGAEMTVEDAISVLGTNLPGRINDNRREALAIMDETLNKAEPWALIMLLAGKALRTDDDIVAIRYVAAIDKAVGRIRDYHDTGARQAAESAMLDCLENMDKFGRAQRNVQGTIADYLKRSGLTDRTSGRAFEILIRFIDNEARKPYVSAGKRSALDTDLQALLTLTSPGKGRTVPGFVKGEIIRMLENREALYSRHYNLKMGLLAILENILRQESLETIRRQRSDLISAMKRFGLTGRQKSVRRDAILFAQYERAADMMNKLKNKWKDDFMSGKDFEASINEMVMEVRQNKRLTAAQKIRFEIALEHLKVNYLGLKSYAEASGHSSIGDCDARALLVSMTGKSLPDTAKVTLKYYPAAPFSVYFRFGSRQTYLDFMQSIGSEGEDSAGSFHNHLMLSLGYMDAGYDPQDHEMQHAFYDAVASFAINGFNIAERQNDPLGKKEREFDAAIRANDGERATRIVDDVMGELTDWLRDEFLAFLTTGEKLSDHFSHYKEMFFVSVHGQDLIDRMRDAAESASRRDIVIYIDVALERVKNSIRQKESLAVTLMKAYGAEGEEKVEALLHLLDVSEYGRMRLLVMRRDVPADSELSMDNIGGIVDRAADARASAEILREKCAGTEELIDAEWRRLDSLSLDRSETINSLQAGLHADRTELSGLLSDLDSAKSKLYDLLPQYVNMKIGSDEYWALKLLTALDVIQDVPEDRALMLKTLFSDRLRSDPIAERIFTALTAIWGYDPAEVDAAYKPALEGVLAAPGESDSRGYSGLDNGDYSKPIRKAIEAGEFSAVTFNGTEFVAVSLKHDAGEEIQGKPLSAENMKRLNACIINISVSDKMHLKESRAVILFIEDLDKDVSEGSASMGRAPPPSCFGSHYGIQRAQYYIDPLRLNNQNEFIDHLHHEVSERHVVLRDVPPERLAQRTDHAMKPVIDAEIAAVAKKEHEKLSKTAPKAEEFSVWGVGARDINGKYNEFRKKLEATISQGSTSASPHNKKEINAAQVLLPMLDEFKLAGLYPMMLKHVLAFMTGEDDPRQAADSALEYFRQLISEKEAGSDTRLSWDASCKFFAPVSREPDAYANLKIYSATIKEFVSLAKGNFGATRAEIFAIFDGYTQSEDPLSGLKSAVGLMKAMKEADIADVSVFDILLMLLHETPKAGNAAGSLRAFISILNGLGVQSEERSSMVSDCIEKMKNIDFETLTGLVTALKKSGVSEANVVQCVKTVVARKEPEEIASVYRPMVESIKDPGKYSANGGEAIAAGIIFLASKPGIDKWAVNRVARIGKTDEFIDMISAYVKFLAEKGALTESAGLAERVKAAADPVLYKDDMAETTVTLNILSDARLIGGSSAQSPAFGEMIDAVSAFLGYAPQDIQNAINIAAYFGKTDPARIKLIRERFSDMMSVSRDPATLDLMKRLEAYGYSFNVNDVDVLLELTKDKEKREYAETGLKAIKAAFPDAEFVYIPSVKNSKGAYLTTSDPYRIFLDQTPKENLYAYLRDALSKDRTVFDGLVNGIFSGIAENTEIIQGRGISAEGSSDLAERSAQFRTAVLGIFEKKEYKEESARKLLQDLFTKENFLLALARYPESADRLISLSRFQPLIENSREPVDLFLQVNMFFESGNINGIEAVEKTMQELGRSFDAGRIFGTTTQFLLDVNLAREFDVDIFIRYVKDVGLHRAPMIFRVYTALARGSYPDDGLRIKAEQAGIAKFGDEGISQLKAAVRNLYAKLIRTGAIDKSILNNPVELDLLRIVSNFDNSKWARNRVFEEVVSDFLSAYIAPLPQQFLEPAEAGMEANLRKGTVTIRRLKKDFKFTEPAVEAYKNILPEIRTGLDLALSADGTKAERFAKEVMSVIDGELEDIEASIRKIEKPEARIGLNQRKERLAGLKSAIVKEKKDLTVALAEYLSAYDKSAKHRLGSYLRILLFEKSFKINNSYVDIFKDMFRSQDLQEISLSSVGNILEFLGNVVKQHVLGEHSHDGIAPLQLNEKTKENLRNRYLQIRSLSTDYMRGVKEVGDAETATLTVVPTRGILGELSGYFCDACWTQQSNIMRDNPEMVAFYFVENAEDPLNARIVGGSLLIPATIGGKEAFVIRGLNPQDRISDNYSSDDLIAGFLQYLDSIPTLSGERMLVIPAPSSGALSNRPAITRSFGPLIDAQKRTALDTPNVFNGYDITENVFMIERRPPVVAAPEKPGADSRGYSGLKNDDYSEPIRTAIESGEFAAVKIVSGKAETSPIVHDNGGLVSGNMQLDNGQLAAVNEAIGYLTDEDKTIMSRERPSILFINDLDKSLQDRAPPEAAGCFGSHYGVARAQYYFDTNLLKDPKTLSEHLQHEIQERSAVLMNVPEERLAQRTDAALKPIIDAEIAAAALEAHEWLASRGAFAGGATAGTASQAPVENAVAVPKTFKVHTAAEIEQMVGAANAFILKARSGGDMTSEEAFGILYQDLPFAPQAVGEVRKEAISIVREILKEEEPWRLIAILARKALETESESTANECLRIIVNTIPRLNGSPDTGSRPDAERAILDCLENVKSFGMISSHDVLAAAGRFLDNSHFTGENSGRAFSVLFKLMEARVREPNVSDSFGSYLQKYLSLLHKMTSAKSGVAVPDAVAQTIRQMVEDGKGAYSRHYRVKLGLLAALENILRSENRDNIRKDRDNLISRMKKLGLSGRDKLAERDSVLFGQYENAAKMMVRMQDKWREDWASGKDFERSLNEMSDVLRGDESLTAHQKIRFEIALEHLKVNYIVLNSYAKELGQSYVGDCDARKLIKCITGVDLPKAIKVDLRCDRMTPYSVYFEFKNGKDLNRAFSLLGINATGSSGLFYRDFMLCMGLGLDPRAHETQHAFYEAVAIRPMDQFNAATVEPGRISENEIRFTEAVKGGDKILAERIADDAVAELEEWLKNEFLAFIVTDERLSDRFGDYANQLYQGRDGKGIFARMKAMAAADISAHIDSALELAKDAMIEREDLAKALMSAYGAEGRAEVMALMHLLEVSGYQRMRFLSEKRDILPSAVYSQDMLDKIISYGTQAKHDADTAFKERDDIMGQVKRTEQDGTGITDELRARYREITVKAAMKENALDDIKRKLSDILPQYVILKICQDQDKGEYNALKWLTKYPTTRDDAAERVEMFRGLFSDRLIVDPVAEVIRKALTDVWGYDPAEVDAAYRPAPDKAEAPAVELTPAGEAVRADTGILADIIPIAASANVVHTDIIRSVKEKLDKLTGDDELKYAEVIRRSVLPAIDSLNGPAKSNIEMALRTAVAIQGIEELNPGGMNVVAQVAPAGLRQYADSANRKIEDKLTRSYNGVESKSIIREISDADGLKQLVAKMRETMDGSNNPSAARGLILLPAAFRDIIPPDMDDRIRVQLVDQGEEAPDLVTQFELGIEMLEHVRNVEKDDTAKPSQRLLNLLAVLADGNIDPHAILSELCKKIINTILKIRRINWQEAYEQHKAWEAVAQSL